MSNDEWTTPQWLFNWLNSRFEFQLDAAATEDNAKSDNYYSAQHSGVANPWHSPTFCNPPYSNVGPWVAKAFNEWSRNEVESCLLIPVRTDQEWWHRGIIETGARVEFYKGRISFGESVGSAWMYNCNVIFGKPTRAYFPSIDVKEIKKEWNK